MSETRVHIHATECLGLTFWDWEITVWDRFGPHLEASGRSNRWAGAASAVERETAKLRSR